jgi:hypothetical protein
MRNLLIATVLFLVGVQISAQAADTPYSEIHRDANSRVWVRTNIETTSSGQVVTNVQKYTELATGMHYTNSTGEWIESKEQIDILPQGGAAATQGRHQVYFPSDIYDGVLEVVTADGRHLRSRPLGVSYDDGSNTVWIGTLKHSTGLLVGSNEVVYPDAFEGLNADLVCKYRRSGFESDLVLRSRLASPDSYGLNSDSATIQLFTEFFNTQDPQQIPSVEDQWFGLQDTTLKFGSLVMTRGKAFVAHQTNSNTNATSGQAGILSTPVFKAWRHLQGRTFLIEEVPLDYVAAGLNTLPPDTNSTASASLQISTPYLVKKFASAKRPLPDAPKLADGTNRTPVIERLFASANFDKKPGLVLDYNTIDSDPGDFTFEADTTYFVDGGFTINGNVTFQSGAVLKFSDALDSATYYYDPTSGQGNPVISLMPWGQMVFQADPFRPVVFTSMDDNSHGLEIDHSSGTPSTLAVPFIGFGDMDSTLFQNARFWYAGVGVIESDFYAPIFQNCEFMYCGIGVAGYGSVLTFQNCLFGSFGTGIEDSEYGDTITLENVTMANWGYNLDILEVDPSTGSWNFPGPFTILNVTNSLFTDGQSLSDLESSLSSVGGTVNGACSADLVGSLQSGPLGNYYLAAGSPHINAGSGSAEQLGFFHFTAQADQTIEADSIVDLGYHYVAVGPDGNPPTTGVPGVPDYQLDSVLPQVAVSAPADNSSFSTTRVNVTGTFDDSYLKQITVNGVSAFINGTSFEALNVPLANGANTITATIEDLTGKTGTASITVSGSATPMDPAQLTATPVAGFAPLIVSFQVTANAPGTFQQVLYDFDGDGTIDQTANNLNAVSHTYSTPGEYFPAVTVVTSAGRFSSIGGWSSAAISRAC